jgi:hypothetical protein
VWRDTQPEGEGPAPTVPPPGAAVLNKNPITGPPYEWVDDDPVPGQINSYWVSWDAPGGTRYAGPSSVLVDSGLEDTLPARVLFVRPNPSRTGSCFRVRQRDTGSAEVTLYTVGGRVVRSLVSDSGTGGSGRGSEFDLCWDGTDDSGQRVSSGAYVWELRVNGAPVADEKGIVTVVR